MTNNKILTLMVENATGDSDKATDNALELVEYTRKHPNDLSADYARDFVSAYINQDYVEMMTVISNFSKYLARECEIVEELN